MPCEKLIIGGRPTLPMVINMLEVVRSDLVSFTLVGVAHCRNMLKQVENAEFVKVLLFVFFSHCQNVLKWCQNARFGNCATSIVDS